MNVASQRLHFTTSIFSSTFRHPTLNIITGSLFLVCFITDSMFSLFFSGLIVIPQATCDTYLVYIFGNIFWYFVFKLLNFARVKDLGTMLHGFKF